jgi:hypothetical protein
MVGGVDCGLGRQGRSQQLRDGGGVSRNNAPARTTFDTGDGPDFPERVGARDEGRNQVFVAA